jgi:F-type H+-transporting ATPase subunit epsilon
MSKRLYLTVMTPAKTLLDAKEVLWVQARLTDGGTIGIYPGHAPLLAETVIGQLRYTDPSGEHVLDLKAGILQVDEDGVAVLTSGLVQISEIVETPEISDVRFDRLAQALLAALQAQSANVSNEDKQ